MNRDDRIRFQNLVNVWRERYGDGMSQARRETTPYGKLGVQRKATTYASCADELQVLLNNARGGRKSK